MVNIRSIIWFSYGQSKVMDLEEGTVSLFDHPDEILGWCTYNELESWMKVQPLKRGADLKVDVEARWERRDSDIFIFNVGTKRYFYFQDGNEEIAIFLFSRWERRDSDNLFSRWERRDCPRNVSQYIQTICSRGAYNVCRNRQRFNVNGLTNL
ncbi:hypothetical protein LOTGIDRAFT_165449 [Lottia gigantea]|uniref:Uncharacterized protein n=1 Tax=Lottia gigantea TaxID=225164 RepID=V4BIY6_LOTGI|nr:hypothetical protein LOTGIDRAFT_165449 [Lottia gigantea]ESO88664.1 hypothetical protein LOTGIDRAFT_165449 [Lottia gigantea]